MKKTEFVSFVVPVYNTQAYLAECIRSILLQEGNYDFEIIMVDDASSDESESVARSFVDSRIKYIRHEKNQGSDVTINHGFSLAKGDFIARIDSDDRYETWFLKETIPILESNQDVGMVYGQVNLINQQGQCTDEAGTPDFQNDFKKNQFLDLLFSNFIPAPTVIARRQAWQDVLPIPSGLQWSDWYLSLKIARTWKLFFKKMILANYRVHPGNMHTVFIRNKKGEKYLFEIFNKIFNEERAFISEHKNKVYASHYAALGNQYFYEKMFFDARRCYLKSIMLNPTKNIKFKTVARLLGACVGEKNYEVIKKIILSPLRVF